MKIASKHARSTSNASSLKSLSTLALAVIGALYGASPAWATPILGADLASFAVLGATGVTNVPVSTIGGNLGSAPNPAVGGGYIFTAGSLQPGTQAQAQLQLDAAILALSAFGVGIDTGASLDAFQTINGGFISPGTYTVSATITPVSYTHLRAHETDSYLVCRLL